MKRIATIALGVLAALPIGAQGIQLTEDQRNKAAALIAQLGVAQQADGPAKFLFAPDLVMANQSSIGLGDAQKAMMRKEIQQAQAVFTELQWKISDEAEKLSALLAPATVDEGATLDAMSKVVGYEAEIKRAQMRLMIRIKNSLTPAQQAKLAEIRGRRE